MKQVERLSGQVGRIADELGRNTVANNKLKDKQHRQS